MFKEVAEYLGLDPEKVKTIDEFKAVFDKDFVRSTAINDEHPIVKSIVGKKIGSLETDIKRTVGNFGIEWTPELKEKKISEKLEFSFNKMVEDAKASLEDFKKTNTGGAEAITKEWTEKYTKLESKFKDTEGLLHTTKSEIDGLKQNYATEKKNFVLNSAKSEALKSLKWKTGIPELMKTGFISQFENQYKTDLEENGTVIVLNKEGQRIPNPKVSGTFMTLNDVLESEAIKADVFEKNPHSGATIVKPVNGNPPPAQPGGKTPFQIHPRAMGV